MVAPLVVNVPRLLDVRHNLENSREIGCQVPTDKNHTNQIYTKRLHMKWLFRKEALFPNRVINFLVTFLRSYNIPTVKLNAKTFLWCIGCHNIRQFLLVWRGDFIQTYFDRDAHAFYSILCVYSSFSRASYVKLLQCPQLLHLIFSVSSMLFLLLLLIFLLHFEFDSRECIT